MPATNIVQLKNLSPQDLNISLTQNLPAAGANVTTGVIDLQALAPNSDAWQLGLFAVVIPALPENTAGAGITIALQAAPPLLTGGAAAVAPLQPAPGAFVTPICSQTITIPAVANGGSLGTIAYFTAAFDANGSTMQFYQFLVTVPAQVASQQEPVTIAWVTRQ